MPRVSKTKYLSPKKKSLFVDDFYSAITSLKNKNEVRAFFEDLLTPEEKLMLAKRFQISMMHRLKYLWGEIKERIKVTNDTVAKIGLLMKYGEGGLQKVSDRIISLKQRKLEQFRQKRKEGYADLGPAILKAGLGVLIQQVKEKKKQRSITS